MKMIRRVFGAVSKKLIVEILLVLCIGSTLCAAPEEGRTLTLVSGGKAECVIITQASQTQGVGIYGERPLRAVIVDLQRILEKMTGAKVPIMTPKEAPAQGTKIYIGEVALPSGIVLDDKELDMRGYWIVAEPQILILRGKTESGTINAIYGFMQDKLGVHWFFPSELFEVVPSQDTVQIAVCREVHNPSFKGGMFTVDSGINQEGQLWSERMRRDAYAFKYQAPAVHYLGYILDSAKYGKTHPEFYPLINGQRRIPPPGRADSGPQPCLSNPDLVEEVVEFCRKTFDDNPNALMVAIGENDSREWCACEKCQAMDVLPLEKYNESEQHSDRFFTFANQVAKAINESHPGKMVGCLAYDGTVTPPKKIAKLEPNVAIGMCLDTSQYYDANYKAKDYNNLAAWKAKCQNILIYNYLSLGWTAPRYFPHLYAQHIKEMHKQGIMALFTQPEPYWATFGPMIYLATQLMWDVNQDPDIVLNDFFLKLFGKEAGTEMKAYYDVFEKAWMRPNSNRSGKYFEGWSYMREQMAVYTLADLDNALKHLEKAKELANDPVVQKRIAYIAKSFSYSATVMRGWLTSDQIDSMINAGEPRTGEQAKQLHDRLLVVSDMLKNEDPVLQKTLRIDPISSASYYKKDIGENSHWEIIRGAWTPRCNYSLRFGLSSLLKYYNAQQMSAEAAVLKGEFSADVLQIAEAMGKESLGSELILNGNMEEGNPPDKWKTNGSVLSASSDSHSGKQSLKISASIAFGSAYQVIAVKPDTRYQIDFWFKCSRPGELYVSVNANVKENSFGVSKVDNIWTRCTATFATPQKKYATTATVAFCSWPDKDTLIDDVSIKEVKTTNLMECKKVDAKFPDWSNSTFVLDSADKLGEKEQASKWGGADKFSASACLGWDEAGLRLAVKVKDTDYEQPNKGQDIWNGDSLQFGIDAGADADKQPYGGGCDDTNDFLYGLSLLDRPGSSPELYRWNAPKGKLIGDIPADGKTHRFGVKQENGVALYDFFVSWEELGVDPKVGDKIGFNLVVFDRYKKEDKTDLRWMQLTPGIAGSSGQSPVLWRKFVIAAP